MVDREEEADNITTEKIAKTVEEASAEATVEARDRGGGCTEKRDWLESVGRGGDRQAKEQDK